MPGSSDTPSDWTQLMTAALSIECEADHLRALILAGADVNAADANGYTALHAAAMADRSEDDSGCMEVLLEAGANPEARADTQAGRGWTPLMLAAAEGFAAQVRTLLKWGADVDAADEDGRTALMLAAGQGFETEEKLRALLDAGADARRQSRDGMTALDYALEYAQVLAGVDDDAVAGIEAELQARVEAMWADLARESGMGAAPPPAGLIPNLRADRRRVLESWDRVIGMLE